MKKKQPDSAKPSLKKSRTGLVIALIIAGISLGVTIYSLASSYTVPLR